MKHVVDWIRTCRNFVELCKAGYYDGTTFHVHITTCPTFVIAKNRFPFITLCNVGKCYDGDKYVY